MFWLYVFAVAWVLESGFMAYTVMNQAARLKEIDELMENVKSIEAMLEDASPRELFGGTAFLQLILAGFDFAGFAVAYSYLNLSGALLWIFVAIVCCYCFDILNDFVHIRKLQRLFETTNDPLPVVSRYLKYCISATSPAAYVGAYGKCLIAVNLLLVLLRLD